jgi:hypothetical protein
MGLTGSEISGRLREPASVPSPPPGVLLMQNDSIGTIQSDSGQRSLGPETPRMIDLIEFRWARPSATA